MRKEAQPGGTGAGSWCLPGLDGSVCVLLDWAVMDTEHLQLCKISPNIWLFSGSKHLVITRLLICISKGQASSQYTSAILELSGLDNNLDFAVRAEVILCWGQVLQAMEPLNPGACGWNPAHQPPPPGLCSSKGQGSKLPLAKDGNSDSWGTTRVRPLQQPRLVI